MCATIITNPKTPKIEPIAIRDAMLHEQVEAPSGKLWIDPNTQYAYRTPMLGEIQSDGQFRIVWHKAEPMAPEPYPDTRTRKQWNDLLARLYERWGGNWSAPASGKR